MLPSLDFVQEPPDAFLVALVFARERLADFPLRYFTLELATTLQGNPFTVIGEWTHTHEHRLHGEGPAPDAQMFMMAVRAIVDNDLPVHSWDRPHL